MNVLITGGAGFLGSHLSDRFLAEGDQVVAVDNLITGAIANIRHLEANPAFRFIEHDISRPLEVESPLDAVLHFASPASPVDYLNHPIETLEVGSLGTIHSLALARAHGARYLLASTSEVYGDPLVHPQSESYWGNVNPIGPRSVYDEAKRFAEAYTTAMHRTHGVQTRIVRIFNTYGPRMQLQDGRVVPNFLRQALRGEPLTIYGDGSQTRSFTYVDDLVDGIYRLLHSDVEGPVNLGNPGEFTIRDFADVVNEITENAGGLRFEPLPEDDPKMRRPDITRARRLLHWEPTVSLAAGLERTLPYFRRAVLGDDPPTG